MSLPTSSSPLRHESTHDLPTTSFLSKYDRRNPLRTPPRRLMALIFAVVFAIVILLSQHPLLSDYTQSHRTSLDTHALDSPTDVMVGSASVHTMTVEVERQLEPIVFALLMYSENSAKEGAILLKSAIMYTSRPLHFHIICDEAAIAYLETRLSLLTHPVHPITVRFYRLTFQNMLDRLSREGSLNTGHAAGTAGLMKLFLHELLPDTVEKAIYVDTDAFFLTDPALLWDEFSRWGPNIAISIPFHPNLAKNEWYNASEICSCIMLLDMQKLRSLRLMDSTIYRADTSGLYPPALAPPLFTALFGPPGPHGYHHVALGDQSYWWAIVSNRTDLFHPLPYDWEVTSCLLDMYSTKLGDDGTTLDQERKAMVHLEDTPYEGEIVIPKLLHFNCLDGVPQYYDYPEWSNPEFPLTKSWKAAVEYHVGFKWLWLNRGFKKSLIDIQMHINPKFADERFAEQHPESISTSESH